MLHRVLRHFSLAALLLAAVLLGVAASASAAIVANGDFEAGSLEGWTHAEQPGGEGAWFAYSRTQEKGGLLTPGPPPSGEWAAGVSNSLPTPETSYLYQNVTLPPASSDRLSMYLYYSAFAPISVPTPNSLFTSESPLAPPNQQVRVDVLRPNAPLESLSPNDVLATVYASKPGDPEVLEPTVLSADLSALAGQTVRLRIAVAVQDGPMEVGVDGVTIESSPLASTLPAPPTPPPAPSNFFAAGKLARDRRHGSARLAVTVPGPGTLSVFDARHKVAIASVRHNPNERPILIRTAAVQTGGAQTVRLPIRPTWAAKKLLAESGRLRFRLQLTFTPVGGLAATKGYMGTLVRKLRRGRR